LYFTCHYLALHSFPTRRLPIYKTGPSPLRGRAFSRLETTMSREVPKPYLIMKGEDGNFRLTVREIRYNGQGYPLVTATPVEETLDRKSTRLNSSHSQISYAVFC